MKNLATLFLVFSLVGATVSMQAQYSTAENFVRNSKVAPDLINDTFISVHQRSIPLVLKSDIATVEIPVLETVYLRASDGLTVTAYAITNKDGNNEVYGIRYEANGLARYAIFSSPDQGLVVAKNLYSNGDVNSGITIYEFDYDSQRGPIAITFSLETIEGQKTSTVGLPQYFGSRPPSRRPVSSPLVGRVA